MCPPSTCDQAIHPPLGGGSIEETLVTSQLDVGAVFSAIGSCSWSSTVSIDRYVSSCSMGTMVERSKEMDTMSGLNHEGPRRRCSHCSRKSAASGIATRYVIADRKCGVITRTSFRRRRKRTPLVAASPSFIERRALVLWLIEMTRPVSVCIAGQRCGACTGVERRKHTAALPVLRSTE